MRIVFTLIGLLMFGCTQEPAEQINKVSTKDLAVSTAEKEIDVNPNKNAYFGDTHVHTNLSFDAYLMGTRRTPDEAYEFAKGAGIEHASGFMMKMKKPLDFLAVADHAFYLGMMRELASNDGPYADHGLSDVVSEATSAEGATAAFQAILGHLRDQDPNAPDDLDDRDIRSSAWQEVIEAAERHNDPGNFTAFIGYEFTSSGPESQNLHRNVIFRGDRNSVPAIPFSRLDSLNPEDLWAWMDTNREQGMESLAIPHNMNGSDGWMFERSYFQSDKPIDAAYADLRMRNEPLVENSQVKGTSDTHPLLSPNDEWADFELMELRIASTLASKPEGSYVRNALLNGMLMEEESGINPYKFGVIAASDTHNAAGSFEEDNYWSKTGLMDINPVNRGSVPLPESDPENLEWADGASSYWGASGLAGVWAESNTRDALYDSFRSKETFATSGPHIRVRFFGGEGLTASLEGAEDVIATAYANGVPMGGDLEGSEAGKPPSFYLWASKDPDTERLQRLQVIKGWIENGERQEDVFDVACSDGGEIDPETNRCPDNGASVDLETCETTPEKGANELSGSWTDPDFDPLQHAFYYVRVLENPKCRWSTWDALRAGTPPNPNMHATIQDRAWSSPIWYNPK
ncbi:DUF3604 domain-containing protein [Gammaproteobacteria bacterium]|nr:DUF3604 domain-containing protein [Gammaproteobacteria bacterium]